MLNKIILVSLGGGLGAAIRELLMLAVPSFSSGFPLALFVANQTASFLIGLLTGWSEKTPSRISADVKVFTITGIMGGLSSFSSFIYGTLSLGRDPGLLPNAILYFVVNIVLGFLLAGLGLRLGRGRKTASGKVS